MAESTKTARGNEARLRRIAPEGGKARAEKLSPEERRDIARQGAAARWGGPTATGLPVAQYGSPDRPLRIGNTEIPCYVLNDGRRVIVQGGMFTALDMKQGTAGRGGGDRLAKFIATKSINPFVTDHLASLIIHPIKFRTPAGGAIAYGYEATILADLCDAVLAARREGRLNYQQDHIAAQCEILVRAFARVGIIALVDEATGYQDQRAHDALARILERFIVKELQPYVKTFPPDFYKEIYRLHGWTYPPVQNRHNSNLGKLTNDLVYDRLAPGVRDKLHELTPRNPSGRLKQKLFQRLTPHFGHPKLREHLGAVVMAMKMSEDWKGFVVVANRLLPKYPRLEDKHGQRNLQLEGKVS
jgi:P63C domain